MTNRIFSRLGRVPRDGGFRQDGYRVWGSTVVRGEDGRFHMFASRIPDTLPFHPGWMVASEIVRASAATPEGPYRFEEVVLPSRDAEYWDGRSTHNPRMIKVGDKYVLYYMGSTHPFEELGAETRDLLTLDSPWCTVGRANKRIGIAVSDSVFGPWQRFDEPALPTRPGTFYSYLTTNPAPAVGPDGRIYMAFKSRAYRGHRASDMHIGVAVADTYHGPYRVVSDEPIFSTGDMGEVEDPFLWCDGDGFHMLAKDQRGTITGFNGAGVLAHSDDCLSWQLDDEPLAYNHDMTWDDGTKVALSQMERCSGLFDEDGKLSHLFFAVWKGSPSVCDETPEATAWNMAVPLLPADET